MPSMENGAFQNDDDDENETSRHRLNGLHKTGLPPSYQDLEPEDLSARNKVHDKEDGLEATFEEVPAPPEKSWKQIWREYPKSVGFIVGNEFCERFSYYGMRAVLTLYLINVLKYEQNTATAIYSVYVMLCYFSPILGSILADGYIGKFHTILWVSLFYAAGNVTIAVAASFNDTSVVHPWLDFIGLAIIGLGTGGIKPCVQTFGGDQFKKGQERELNQFFSIFYFSINAGSTISILLTPFLRTKPCQDRTTCYPLAFGVPSALMVVAVVFFAIGSYWYKKAPPAGNVFSKVAKVSCTAVSNKRVFDIKREHWLDHYMDSHSCSNDSECRDRTDCQKAQFVKDIKALLRVLVVYVPLPIFWALYEQQGSTWVIQGTQMNSEIADGLFFLPDQMQVLNAILIMALIPTFQIIIYPLVGKFFKLTPLRKMSAGGLLAGVSYIVCMLVQFNIRDTLPRYPASGQTLLTVTNYVQECQGLHFVAKTADNVTVLDSTILRDGSQLFPLTYPNQQIKWEIKNGHNVTEPCDWVQKQALEDLTTTLAPDTAGYTIFADDVNDTRLQTQALEKSQSGESVFTININFYAQQIPSWAERDGDGNFGVALCKDNNVNCSDTKDPEKFNLFAVSVATRTSVKTKKLKKYGDVKPGNWGIYVQSTDDQKWRNVGEFIMKANGGIFSLTILANSSTPTGLSTRWVRQAPDNTVSILWQVPQYVVISVAEILFSITGNEFAYSQAPLSMKAVVFAFYLLTDSFGNVIILIIASASTAGFDASWIFLIYACIMFAVMILFMYIAYRYKYVYYVRDDKATN